MTKSSEPKGFDNPSFDHELSEISKKNGNDGSLVINEKGGFDTNNYKSYDDKDDDDLESDRCGFFGLCSPEWIQPYATKKVFMVVFSLLGVVQGMTWSYFSATISTLEKRFKISSQTTGIVMTGNETSQIIFSLLISYYGAKGHRPRWIATGVLFSAIACFVIASPQFIFGSGQDALIQTREYSYLRYLDQEHESPYLNESSTFKSGATPKEKVTLCNITSTSKSRGKDNCDEETSIAPLLLIFFSQFVAGIGVLLYFTLGGPYLDDNSKRKNVPMLFGITMSMRLVGPTFGYTIASGALKLYINPFLTPLISSTDPRWIGAWWLGWTLFGTLMTIFAFFLALFPRRLRSKRSEKMAPEPEPEESVDKVPKITEIPKAVKLLLKNKINMFNNLAGLFYLFASIGYWTYMPKYMETTFLQTASTASITSGVVGILSQSTGMLLSGYLISRFQFSARKLTGWNVFTALMTVLSKIIFTQIGCDVKTDFGTRLDDGKWNLTASCNENCHCKASKILPVCHQERSTVYYSACHAGCQSTISEGLFGNCSCIPDPSATVKLGLCSEGCGQMFMVFLAVTAFIKFVDATGRIGNMLISYRCVKHEERSLAIGLHLLLLSAFAFLPSPIVFGRIIDSVCLVWGGATCGKEGNCNLYDGQQLRYIFNLTAAAFIFVGAMFDTLVWWLSKDLELYKEPDEDTQKNEKSQTTK